jgi:hypothetical protein
MKRHKHITVWVYIQRKLALLGPPIGLDDVSQYILRFYEELVKILIDCLTPDEL